MVLYFILWVLSVAIGIVIMRYALEVPKITKRADDILGAIKVQTEVTRKQNDLLTLLLHSDYNDKKIALINITTSSVKTIDIKEIGNYDLSLYEIQVLKK